MTCTNYAPVPVDYSEQQTRSQASSDLLLVLTEQNWSVTILFLKYFFWANYIYVAVLKNNSFYRRLPNHIEKYLIAFKSMIMEKYSNLPCIYSMKQWVCAC